jgi:hypothetical protein
MTGRRRDVSGRLFFKTGYWRAKMEDSYHEMLDYIFIGICAILNSLTPTTREMADKLRKEYSEVSNSEWLDAGRPEKLFVNKPETKGESPNV